MPKRTREHELEARSRHELRGLFIQAGWTVEDITFDYGEDLFVRIFIEGRATHWIFYIQAKATEHIDRYLTKDGKSISVPLDQDHLDTWITFGEPVLLTLWDANADITYWTCIQDSIASQQPRKAGRKTGSVLIPVENVLCAEALTEIRFLTMGRSMRLEREQEGAATLVRLLEETLNARIFHHPEFGMMFIEYPTEKVVTVLFGIYGQIMGSFAAQAGMSIDEYIQAGIPPQLPDVPSGGRLHVRDTQGNISRLFDQPGDFTYYMLEQLAKKKYPMTRNEQIATLEQELTQLKAELRKESGT